MELAELIAPGIEGAPTWKQASVNYHVLKKLGRGAQGEVLLVEDMATGQLAVAKVALDPQAAVELQSEAGALWRLLGVRSVPELIESGLDYSVSEFVEGIPMDKVVFDGIRTTLPEKLCLIRDIASTLAQAHDRNVIHADIKPENILVTGDRLVVLDFGLAFEPSQAPWPRGFGVGTPYYMSPEQSVGDWTRTGPATDIYALGVLTYEMLTNGHHPFEHLRKPPEPPYPNPIPPREFNARIPIAVERLILRLIDPEPKRRPTARSLMRALSGFAKRCPWVRHS